MIQTPATKVAAYGAQTIAAAMTAIAAAVIFSKKSSLHIAELNLTVNRLVSVI